MGSTKPKPQRRVRTPIVLQMESTECGAASLGIILGYHGRHVPLEELRLECRVSRDGSNALYVKKTAEKFGLVVKGYRKAADTVRELRPPFIAFWEMAHFLVVEGFGRDRVYLNDPASGRRVVDLEEFRLSYSGLAFTFEPGPGFRKGGERPRILPAIVRRLRGAKAAMVFVVLLGVALLLGEFLAAAASLVFVDRILIDERWHWVRPLLVILGLSLAYRLVAGGVQYATLQRLRKGLAATHSARFLWHVLRLPILFYQQRYAGDVSGRVDGNSQVAELISGQLATTLVGLLMIVFYGAVMVTLDPLLAALGVAIGGLNLAGIAAGSRLLADENFKAQQVRGKLIGSMMRAVQIIETIKAGASESEALVRLAGYQARVTNAAQIVAVIDGLLVALPALVSVATSAVILGIGGSRVIDGVLSIGALVAFQALLAQFNRPFGDLVRLGSSTQKLQGELARLEDVLQYQIDPVFEAKPAATAADSDTRRPPLRRLSGHIEIKNVSFGFNRAQVAPLIQGFSLELRPGSRVALVGASGSGKSTIGRLVAGLYRPWEGEILYDGMRIEEVPRAVFTDQVALVDDQALLFPGTVRENLTLWDATISERDMIKAAMDASIHRDLIARRGSYQVRLAEGARNFSGGQRQRLEIARALIRNPAVVVFDEATSALDPVTEVLVDDHLRRRGCTCLIVAHRLSTIRDCDEILALQNGKIVQRGTHDELMDDVGGFYHELQTLHAGDDSADLRPPPSAPQPDARRRVFPAPAVPQASGPALAPHPASTNGTGGSNGAARERTPAEVAQAVLGVALAVPVPPEPQPADLMEALAEFCETAWTAGNAPLPLDDEISAWHVASGQVDLFYLQPEPGDAAGHGRRRHLCRVEEGGAIFALEGIRGDERGELLAVGVGPARLDRFPKAALLRFSHEPDLRADVARMVNEWVSRISAALEPGDPPRSAARLEPGEASTLDAGAIVTPRRQVLWIRPAHDDLRFLGAIAVPPCSLGSRFPLSPHVWVTLPQAGSLQVCDTETLLENGDPWVGLQRFHRVILDTLLLQHHRDVAVAEERRDDSLGRDGATIAAALTGLAGPGLIVPGRPGEEAGAGAGSGTAALLEACRAVAAASGIEISSRSISGADDALRQIARSSGFRTRRLRLGLNWWRNEGGPLLGFLAEGDRPVALVPAKTPGYVLLDPRAPLPIKVSARVARTLKPSAVMFYPTLPSAHRSARDLCRFGLPVVRHELKALVLVGLLGGLLGVITPVITGIVVGETIPAADHPQLALLCAALVAAGLAVTSFQAMQGLALARIRGKLESTLLLAAWDRLFNLPARFFGHYESGELAQRALGLGRVIEVFTSTSLAALLLALFSLINMVVLLAYNLKLGLLAIGLLAVAPLVTLAAVRPLWRLQRQSAHEQGQISGLLFLLLSGISRLRVAGAERRAFARWAERYRRQMELMVRFRRVSDRLMLFGDLWPLVVTMAVFGAVAWLGPGAIGVGDFLAFNTALMQGLVASAGLARGLLPLLEGLEQYERFRPILEAEPEVASSQGGAVTLEGALRLTDVSFRYSEEGPLILDGVNLQVRPGEFVAVVGPSGSGKSTLLRLLLGFETPTTGVVAYDGRELVTLDVQEVRRQIGVVLQDAQLQPGDVYSNIVGLSPNLTGDDAWEALELAGLAEDIEQMPMGLHTIVTEGGGALSSGQRQRLLIARALARRPRILFFDEATSALDNRTQAHVSKSIHEKLRGTTRLAIAHRLSTIVAADRIYVLSGGKIVQSGTYTQLMREPGTFRDLARRQTLDEPA